VHGLFVASASTTAFSIVPRWTGIPSTAPRRGGDHRATYSWVFIATAPFVRGRQGPRALANTIVLALIGLFCCGWASARPGLTPAGARSAR
jgi:hypothetical protein